MDTSASLNAQISEKTLYLILNRPEKHNCFGIPELEEIERALREAESNPDVRAVVFKGAGEYSFSTGADLKQFKKLDRPGTVEWIKKGHTVFNYLEHYPKPTVAVIQGYALGGGLELALCCDFRIASDKATFGCPELRHGWLPGWGGIYRLKKLLGTSHAKDLLFLGERISAEEAFRIGLINRCTRPEELEQKTAEMLEKLRLLEANTFAMAKGVLTKPLESDSPSQSDSWFDVLSSLYAKE